jgi:hypothetical protein
MKLHLLPGLFLLSVVSVAATPPPEPKFRHVTIDARIQIGYGVAVADVDGDKLPDILLADKKQFVWYRNPGPEKAAEEGAWQKFILAENLTEKDNVCIAAQDIDGDGKCEVAVGAEWNPADTVNSGAVFYLIPPADRTQPWQPVKLHAEPTTHRMRWIKLENNRWGLVVVPLHGRGNKNGEGVGVKVLLYHPPIAGSADGESARAEGVSGQAAHTPQIDPKAEWKTELINESMRMTHNFEAGKTAVGGSIVLGGKEGFVLTALVKNEWQLVSDPNWPSRAGSVGVGEICSGRLHNTTPFIAPFFSTVEPMHGNCLVVYRPTETASRLVLTDKLSEGHALASGDPSASGAIRSSSAGAGRRGKRAAPPASPSGRRSIPRVRDGARP